VPTHVRVHRRQRVVQQDDVSASIASASQRHALLLAAAEVDAALADLRVVACIRRHQWRATHCVSPLTKKHDVHVSVGYKTLVWPAS
jgi:hypothetical protein